jgi:hypothetical protein
VTRKSWAYPDLPRYTWDQAHILGLATAKGFAAFGIAAPTVRGWASAGKVTPVGKAPGGALLFRISEVAGVGQA